MNRVLKLIFRNPNTGKNMTWTIADPKTDLTKVGVANVMNYAISNEAVKIGADYESTVIEVYDAYIYTTQKIEVA